MCNRDFVIYGTWCVAVVLATGMCSCKREPVDRQQLMLANANERLVELEEKLMIDCRATIMYQANLIVDSLLIARARADKDTILKPMKPDKPLRPDILTPLDSADVQPLFKE